MKTDQPASIPVLISATLSTGVALIAVFLLIDAVTQGLIIAFGNSVIALGAAVWLNARNTSTSAPVLPEGTPVRVEGTDEVAVVSSPPIGKNETLTESEVTARIRNG